LSLAPASPLLPSLLPPLHPPTPPCSLLPVSLTLPQRRDAMAHLRGVAEASARIFGNVIGNGLRSGHKVLSQKLIGDKVVAWYPEPVQKMDPLYVDPTEPKRVLKIERMKRRGKGVPKKGEGKRAGKRK
ncbi:unnamed protein product, partial [Closterium sp. NIES-54]